jgi:hypothetical protein
LRAFLGHSFAVDDRALVEAVVELLREVGFEALTGEAPEARGVAQKVRSRIEAADVFVALLTHRHPIPSGGFTTSPWVIEEKGYFLGLDPNRPIVMLVEKGIAVPNETGGIGGDLEYIALDRYDPDTALKKLHAALSDAWNRASAQSAS